MPSLMHVQHVHHLLRKKERESGCAYSRKRKEFPSLYTLYKLSLALTACIVASFIVLCQHYCLYLEKELKRKNSEMVAALVGGLCSCFHYTDRGGVSGKVNRVANCSSLSASAVWLFSLFLKLPKKDKKKEEKEH